MAKRYIKQLLIAFDQLVNALIGGWADETLSSRLYRLRDKNKLCYAAYWFVNALFFDKAHCKSAYYAELQNKQLPPAMRGK